jgi:uncharacterized protein YceK
MKIHIQIYLSTIIVVMMISGCASVGTRAFTPPGHETFYPGLEGNYEILKDESTGFTEKLFLGVLDFPFSFCLDTILLPFDTYDYYKNKHEEKSSNKRVDFTVETPVEEVEVMSTESHP